MDAALLDLLIKKKSLKICLIQNRGLSFRKRFDHIAVPLRREFNQLHREQHKLYQFRPCMYFNAISGNYVELDHGMNKVNRRNGRVICRMVKLLTLDDPFGHI